MTFASSNPEQIRYHSLHLVQVGDYASARPLLEGLLQNGFGNDFLVLLGLSIACLATNEILRAEEAIDRALLVTQDNLQALLIKGRLRAQQGDTRTSIAYFKEAQRLAQARPPENENLRRELNRAVTYCGELERQMLRHIEGHVSNYVRDSHGALTRFGKSLDFLVGRRYTFDQNPHHHFFPELPTIEVYSSASFEWAAQVEERFGEIRIEAMRLLEHNQALFEPYVQPNKYGPKTDASGMMLNPDWSAVYVIKDGELQDRSLERFPHTLTALKTVPLTRAAKRMPSVLFSRLRGRSKIPPHRGMLNSRLICHLPLIVPSGCGLRVGNERLNWQEGKIVVFNDSIEHEAWNDSDYPRLNLIFEIWRPELTADEISALQALLEALDGFGSSSMAWSL